MPKSVIGPRPEQFAFARKFQQDMPAYGLRHLVKPGITGWAQVNHGYAASSDETRTKLEYDLYYVKNLSPWLDATVVLDSRQGQRRLRVEPANRPRVVRRRQRRHHRVDPEVLASGERHVERHDEQPR